MFFHEKFSYMYRLLNLNHKMISKQCGFDVSLLSRWKNGNRVPSYKNGQYRDLAVFFLSQIKNTSQRDEISMILSSHRTIATHLSDEVDLLEDWLLVSNPKPQIPLMNYTTNSDTLSQLRNIITNTDYLVFNPDINLDKSTRTDVYIYKDNKGKREAIIYFLNTAFELNEPTDIFIFSDEDQGWWMEDENFPALWANYLKGIAHKGHRLSVIFLNSRPSEQYIRAINTWFPLMFNGKVNAYYFPNYNNPAVKSTTFIIKDTLAYVSLSSQLSDEEKIGYLHFDTPSIQMQTALFLGRMATCRSLVTTYTEETQLSLLDRMNQSETLESQGKMFSQYPSAYFLPVSVFERYALTLPSEVASRYMSMIRRYLQVRAHVFSSVKVEEAVVVKTLRDLILDPEHHFFESRFFGNRIMKLTHLELTAYLNNIILAIENNPNYSLFFLRRPNAQRDFNVNISAREHVGVVLCPTSPSSVNHIAIFSTESNTIYTIYQYLTLLFDQIPSVYKQREETIKVLNDLQKLLI